MNEINEDIKSDGKTRVCNDVLWALPRWFGIESSIAEYAKTHNRRRFMRSISTAIVIIICLTVISGCTNNLNSNGNSRGSRMNFSNLLKSMGKSSIRIEYDKEFDSETPVGASKIGGKPDLPPDFEWFYFQGESYEGVSENRPLSFLAQINCEEANKYDKDSMLPSKGMLYFFYELVTMTWGFDPKDKGSARVYYYPGDTSELNRINFPTNLLDEYKVPEMPISFSSINELPAFEEFIEWHEGFEYSQWDDYDRAKITMGFKSEFDTEEEEEEGINKLLGYADIVQNGMLLQCELTTSGFNTGSPDGYDSVSEQQKEDSKKWQLLLQLDSIQTEKYEMLWGDVGRIYFYINTDALKVLNFESCWLILQCG